MELVPGKRYRFWVKGEPLDYSLIFVQVILHQKRPPLPRLEPIPPLPIEGIWLEFRYDTGYELYISDQDIKGMGIESVDT